MIRRIAAVWLLLAAPVQADVLLTQDEIALTLSFGPWPPVVDVDPSNHLSGNPDAISLGAELFSEPLLSEDGAMSCASCHDPERAFAHSDARALGREILPRNAPSLHDLAGLRWYGWGGKSDNLWAASLHPIIADLEMGQSAQGLKTALSKSDYATRIEALLGNSADMTPDTFLVDIAKSLAAYQETLISEPTPFDHFRDALENGDMSTAGRFPDDAQRGLQLFLGRGNCIFCHSGPRFSNNEFHDAGVPYFLNETEVDPGRFDGLQTLLTSPYTLDGPSSDDPERRGAWAVRNVRQTHADFGTFRTPTLRGVAGTAPYMHDGSLPTLEDVVDHYDTIDLERLHTDGEAILRPLELTREEASDLVAFLKSLGSP